MGLIKNLVTSLLALTSLVSAASLQQVTNFGSNPSGALMYIYVPDNLKANPSIIVAIHYCTGTAQAYYSGTKYAQLASQYNYIVIYPQSPYSGTCWDVSSKATLTHNGGGNSNAIANMVTYTIQKYSADASRVYVTGSSSGAMMTNVLAATYPEMFKAGSVYNGVPAGCFYTGTVDGWNSTCSQGNSIHSVQDWANTARAMYPGYSGSYPRMLIYHGDVDTTLAFPNYGETIKQWSGIFGYSTNPQQTLTNDPSSPYTKYIYGQSLVGIVGHNIGHTVPVHETEDLEWFGYIPADWVTTTTSPGSPPTTSTKPPTTSTTSTSAPPTTTSSGGGGGCTVAQWGQCGGSGYSGCTTCASGFTCKYSNDWYSQCL